MWIEDFRTLKNANLNFHANFEFEFEKENKTLKVKKFYLNNKFIYEYFPKNQFISLIVGKNGTGKSSILDIYFELIKENSKYKFKSNWIILFYDTTEKRFKYLSNLNFNIANEIFLKDIEFEKEEIRNLNVKSIYLSWHNVITNKSFYATDSFRIKNKKHRLSLLQNYIHLYEDFKYISHVSKDKNLKFPSELILYLHFNLYVPEDYSHIINEIIRVDVSYAEKLKEEILSNLNYFSLRDIILLNFFIEISNRYFIYLINQHLESIQGIERRPPKKFINAYEKREIKDLLIRELSNFRKFNIKFNLIERIIEKAFDDRNFLAKEFPKLRINRLRGLFSNIEELEKRYEDFKWKSKIIHNAKFTKEEKIVLKVEESVVKIRLIFSNLEDEDFGSLLKHLVDLLSYKDLLDIEMDYYPPLSTGQEQFIKNLALINRHISKSKEKNIILFLDEPDMYFHPEWQRLFIYFLTEFLKRKFPEKNFHIIITTHSPFLLSDIPKENCVFLDLKCDEKKQECITEVISREKLSSTLAQNIYYLLADGFFMEKGIGEYIRLKLSEILKGNIKDHEFYKELVSRIGDEIYRKRFETYLEKLLERRE